MFPQGLNEGFLQEGNRCDFMSTFHFPFYELGKKAVVSEKNFFKSSSRGKSS